MHSKLNAEIILSYYYSLFKFFKALLVVWQA